MTNQRLAASIFVLATCVLLVYHPALTLSFFGDDYLFIETAGRSSFWQYVTLYFDPRVQTAWYRPMQGMRYGLIYALFGAQPLAYHLVNVLVHVGNCLLLFGIVGRLAQNWRIALVTTLLYAGLPLYSVAVFWPGVADFVMTLFFLSAILAWIIFRQFSNRVSYLLALIFFILALLTKELAVTLPAVLFLLDWGLVRAPMNARALAKLYAPFALLLCIYAPIEYTIQARGIFVNTYGYGTDSPVMSNLAHYLAALTFPWLLPEPWNMVWLVGALALALVVTLWKASRALLALAGIAALTVLPVVPFPWIDLRYLYLPVMVSCVLFAILIHRAQTRASRWKRLVPFIAAALVFILCWNGLGVQSKANDFNELARQARVPFRDISQRHRTFPPDTYLYFVDPLPQVAELSGMFFLRYGPDVTVGGNTGGTRRAELTRHRNSYVIWFDEERRTREARVDETARVSEQPIDLTVPIRLLGYEMPSTKVQRGEAFIIILYWQALQKIDQDYKIAVRLRDTLQGNVVAMLDGAPRADRMPTSTWRPDEMIIDARVVIVPADVRLGNDYQLEIEVYEPSTRQIFSPSPIVISPLSIVK